MVDLMECLAAWDIPGLTTHRLADAGTNNLSRQIDTPAGPYLLRIYQNTSDPGRIRFEHALLLALQREELSFSVPLPLATRRGETYVELGHDGRDAVAALFPLIPGRHPEYGNVAAAARCGEALAELDDALTRIEVDPSLPRPTMYGQLDKVHPLVADPLAMVEQIAVPAEGRAHHRAVFAELLEAIPSLYAHLPRQIIHGDFFAGNVLMDDDHVQGILDFEFSSPDLGVMDFAVGISAFGVARRDSGDPWPLVQAFSEGYRRRRALTGEEITALPMLVLLREATSLIHWTGRHRQGLTTEGDVAGRADELLALDAWLRAYGLELQRQVERAMG